MTNTHYFTIRVISDDIVSSTEAKERAGHILAAMAASEDIHDASVVKHEQNTEEIFSVLEALDIVDDDLLDNAYDAIRLVEDDTEHNT